MVRIFPTQLAIKRRFIFPPHSLYAFALPRKIRSSEIYVEINWKPDKTFPTLSIVTWKKT